MFLWDVTDRIDKIGRKGRDIYSNGRIQAYRVLRAVRYDGEV